METIIFLFLLIYASWMTIAYFSLKSELEKKFREARKWCFDFAGRYVHKDEHNEYKLSRQFLDDFDIMIKNLTN